MQQPFKNTAVDCWLYLPEEGRWIRGDMWRQGHILIHNGVVNPQGEPLWSYASNPSTPPPLFGERVISLRGEYFSRRGVTVSHITNAIFNETLQEHLDATV